MRFKIRKGLDIAIPGAPEQAVAEGPRVDSVALLGADTQGVRPDLLVGEGDRVTLGQTLFTDRKRPEVRFAAPAGGTVAAINRGKRRALTSIVIQRDREEEQETTSAEPRDRLAALGRDAVAERLLASGLWTAFRTRPYGKVPDSDGVPHSIFVTAMDSNPLAARAEVVIAAYADDFADGLAVLAQLTPGPVFLCIDAGAEIPLGDSDKVKVARFAGPHPAGLAGTHIHFLDPVGAGKTVWHLGYQDVIAIGRLFTTGRLWVERIVALAGPMVRRPRLIRTRLGANLDDLVAGELREGPCRVVSGSLLSGRRAAGPEAYLGRYDTQVSVLAEAGRGEAPRPSTALNGAPTAMVPLGGFERVVPLDILPTQLLRALLVGDIDMARALGCLELDEEDLALCSYLCPSKIDYGPLLRACLAEIEKEA
ncbi:MAG: NADH:ubiquinone reductase (Na(+)-transporting) subunit A [Rhodospirillales bacterium]|nr:NADH:ubiquinone reductase (Na(+)-transporting) subunit A [Rhodospirillales bacterium]MDH3911189.1 NADH:ubiquinone reductase (Na(+)-transporting) subunit A [Rhodospirillales bacterium]MDH3920948.1 NADH:ubiquinone reductase (Na(+)-transporting) subunit A [Rhodospirillales bacterium]MDH3967593.1 NADH:ubiquinone reductase (Na(+)-transporting) subunit A [Rhodospirillales bacterium]